nr:uncharacterized protein LOC113401066 [Vanessa tameamea]
MGDTDIKILSHKYCIKKRTTNIILQFRSNRVCVFFIVNMLHLIFIMFLMQYSIAKTYTLEVRGERPVKDSEDYIIQGFHKIVKRGVYNVETFSRPTGMHSKEQTVIVVPNEGSATQTRNNANKETVVVMSSDNNRHQNRG